MQKIKFLFILIYLIGCKSSAQELTCTDFKNGTFVITATEEVPYSYKIIRNGNKQTEITEDPMGTLPPDFQKTQYVLIEWIDECTYRAKYDTSKMNMLDFHKLVNASGGITTEIVEIVDDCFYVKSTLTVKGEVQTINDEMCLE